MTYLERKLRDDAWLSNATKNPVEARRAKLAVEAADEIKRLRVMAYQPPSQHEETCDCITCVPF